MARRNMRQIIERTEVPDKYQLVVSEWCELADMKPLDGTRSAFIYGFALGMRYQKKKGAAKK